MAAGQTVFSLAADGEREVLIGLPEHSFERFRIGQPVSVELWSQRDRRFAGHIRESRPRPIRNRVPSPPRVAFDDATSGRTGPERAGLRRRRRGGAVIGSLVGADRRGRPGVRLGGRAGRLDPAPAGGAHRSLCRGPGAGARRPEGWRLGGGHRGPGASRRAAGASDRPGQPHGETGGQGASRMSFNLPAWALQSPDRPLPVIPLGAVGVAVLQQARAGEDPPFTFKAMVVQTNWPGASTEGWPGRSRAYRRRSRWKPATTIASCPSPAPASRR
ncbi:hypothetical protein ACPA9J_16115 [Pseudomonas aeruginosa]